MRVAEATAEHWPRIFPFFASIVAAGDTYSYPDGLTSDEARALWMPGPPARTVVVVDGDHVLGSALMGPNRPARGSHVATASVMVDPGSGGRGVGRALGEHVIGWARASGYRGIQFNAVVETNARAVALWRSLGFGIVGTVPGAFRSASHGFVGLHVMHLDLTRGGDETSTTRDAP